MLFQSMIIDNVKVLVNYDKTCICKLNSSQHISNGFVKNGIVYASTDQNGQVYLACSIVLTNTSSLLSSISIPNFLLNKLQFKADDFITLSILDPSTIPLLSSVSLDVSSFGLDLLRNNETQLEQSFLLQCSFVYLNMPLPVWCGNQLVYCVVDNFHPISIESRCGRLDINTTLHLNCRQHGRASPGKAVAFNKGLAPDSTATSSHRNCDTAALVSTRLDDSDVIGGAVNWLPRFILPLVDFICRWLLGYGIGLAQLLRLRAGCRRCLKRVTIGPVLLSPLGTRVGFQRPLLLQVRPISEAETLLVLAEPNSCLVNPRHLPLSSQDSSEPRWCLVQVQSLGLRDLADSSDNNAKSNEGPLLLKLLPSDSVPIDCLTIAPSTAAAIGLASGAWVHLSRPLLSTENNSTEAAIFNGCIRLKGLRLIGSSSSLNATKQELERFIKTRTVDNPALVLHNRKLAFVASDGTRHACFTELLFNSNGRSQSLKESNQQQQPLPCALLCRELSPKLSITLISESSVNSLDTKNEDLQMPDWLSDVLDPLITSLMRQFLSAIVQGSNIRLNYLALLRDDNSSGASGKSALLRSFAIRLRDNGFYAGDPVDCRRLTRLEFDSARKRLWRMGRLAAARAPACLLLDNLDAVCAPIEDNIIGTGVEVHQLRLCHLVRSLLKWIRHQPGVMLLATSTGQLNAQLIDSATGQCLFDSDTRLDIRLNPTDAMRQLLSKSGDGLDFSNRCLTIGEYSRCSHILAYCQPELAEKLNLDVTLGAVRQVKDECDPARARLALEYDQICGLDSAKTVLERAIIWPLRFPRLVQRVRGVAASAADASVQVATAGVLLTGPSGCGKSLLAMALARRLRLRLLAVRGPELLSKFVGASERAVRDLFAKARRLRPCLVFLDEVDALAPRRGNDSTGVTDRVVNQLLTELDGLDTDGLAGIALLAATNRPDLVDPALLRPGRIGLRASCPQPERDDRRSILASLLTADGCIEAANDQDLLDCLADATEGYCSADFNALLLAAAVETSEGCRYGRRELTSALDKVRPSLLSSSNVGNLTAGLAALQPGRRLMFA